MRILQRASWAAAVAALALGLFLWVVGLRIYAAQMLFGMTALPLAVVAVATLAATLLRRREPPSPRRRVALALALPVLALASIPVGRSLAFARAREDSGDGRTVTVITYNVLFRGGNPTASLGLLGRYTQADVLAFQEVTPAWLPRLTATLGTTHPHRAARAVPGTHGLAVFSRFALGEPAYLANRAGRAVAQCVPVLVPRAPFLLCNAHLASPAAAFSRPSALTAGLRSNAELRTAQWRELRDLVGRRFPGMRQRLILAGDLNTLDSEPLYAEIRRDLVDAFRGTRWLRGATFPNSVDLAPAPLVRIDYVLVSPAIRPIGAEVLPPAGSDHLGVRAQVRVPHDSAAGGGGSAAGQQESEMRGPGAGRGLLRGRGRRGSGRGLRARFAEMMPPCSGRSAVPVRAPAGPGAPCVRERGAITAPLRSRGASPSPS